MKTDTIVLPEVMPVMVLSGATLFPHGFLPLRIFEPRYRRMLASVLDGDRIFAVGMARPDADGEEIFPVAGAGLVRACVGQPDGTSQLILQGIGRVGFDSIDTGGSFPAGRAKVLTTVTSDRGTCLALHRELREFCTGLAKRRADLPEAFPKAAAEIDDPETLGDVCAQGLVRNPLAAQGILSEAGLDTRLRLLLSVLREEWGVRGD